MLSCARLEREGWQFAGIVEAPDLKLAELRYLEKRNIDGSEPENFKHPTLKEPVFGRSENARLAVAGLFPE